VNQSHPIASFATMDWNRVEGSWKEMKGKIKDKWGKLTDDDLNVINGKRDRLEGRIRLPGGPCDKGIGCERQLIAVDLQKADQVVVRLRSGAGGRASRRRTLPTVSSQT
jgi:uncharacterized protein YjbJ (UPF0337 family)